MKILQNFLIITNEKGEIFLILSLIMKTISYVIDHHTNKHDLRNIAYGNKENTLIAFRSSINSRLY